jgi:hypothetical protein
MYMELRNLIAVVLIPLVFCTCKKENKPSSPGNGGSFNFISASINDSLYKNTNLFNVSLTPVIRASFSKPIDKTTVIPATLFTGAGGQVPVNYSYSNNDSVLILQPTTALHPLTAYSIRFSTLLKSVSDSSLKTVAIIGFATAMDSTDKFAQVTDSALLTLVQQQTFKYFWDFGHPVSGLARERSSSADVVTSGGSGFGVMALLVGINRGFITRVQGLDRVTTMVSFLTNNATRYHGAFPHWLNGASGTTIPFTTEDDGADLVETAYLMQGLLCARQFFNSSSDPNEINLRSAINNLWNGVQWAWFRKNGQNALYWHWSPDYGWSSNQQINGWNEALITYILAASSNVDSNAIPKVVYDNGWAENGGIKNGTSYFGIPLPLGPPYGGPLFFAHYSFLGVNPHDLTDAYANYWTQDTAHAQINYKYCVSNPGKFNGYSALCWGLTASDEQSGYGAHAPFDSDDGVITPTAAISSLPYTPDASMNALKFFYYKLGDKIWGQYGFIDAFNLTNLWFDSDFLAIDQGPEIVMIENYRTGLLWNLFMSCPEIKTGMMNLGFQSPNF